MSVSPDTFANLPRKDQHPGFISKCGCSSRKYVQTILLFFKRKSSYHVAVLIVVAFCQQKEEGKVQGQLNHTDSTQYIRDLKSQIEELKHEVRRPSLILHLLCPPHVQMSDRICSFSR